MMNKKIYSSLVCVLLPIVLTAQSLVMDNYVPSDPQVWSFIKYGGQTPDLYTGTVRAEIPIYTYKDPDFEIPIALSYASNGYMPNIQANFVGLGWTLIAGGAITRRVNGKKDEDNDNSIYGFYSYSKNNTQPEILLRDTTYRSGQFYYEIGNNAYETEPDIFLFNFLGHQGKFIIKEQGGTVRVYDTNHPSGEYKVDIRGLSTSGMFRSLIVITTGDGYVYEFGVIQSIIDYHTSYETYEEKDSPIPPASISYDKNNDSWVLTRIVAPNGRYISFEYDIDQNTIGVGSCHPFVQKEVKQVYTNYGDGEFFFDAPSSLDQYTKNFGRTVATVPVARLARIRVYDKGGQTQACLVTFYYENRTPEKYFRPSGSLGTLLNPGLLKSITVTGKSNHFNQTYQMDYSYTGTEATPGNRVLLLKKVSIPGLGDYEMEYYNENIAYPFHGCVSVDHWGYWNNYDSNYSAENLLPRTSVILNNSIETVLGTNRNPDAEVSKSGMLTKITYPTGGWTEYVYEAHEYGRIITKDASSATGVWPHVENLSVEKTAGGLRVKRITDYVSADEAVTKEYEYSYFSDSSNVSSGLMYFFPKYYNVVRYKDGTTPSKWLWGVSRTDRPAYLLDLNYIGYSKVREQFVDKSFTEYQFFDYEDVPDNHDYHGTRRNIYNAMRELNLTPEYADYYDRVSHSMHRCRGVMKEKRSYDASMKPTETTVYSYNRNLMQSAKVSSLKATFDSVYVSHTYIGDCPLTSETHTVYSTSGGQSVVTTTSYAYNNLGQLKRRTVGTADGATYNENYLYVKDLTGRSAAQDTMVSRNILSPVVYKTLSLTKPGIIGARLIEGTRQLHGLFLVAGQQLPVVTEVSTAVVSSAVQYTSPYSLTWKPQTTVSAVDGYGRPMEVKDANGIYTTYFWGYGGMYLAGRFVNCSLSQLAQRFHASFNQYDAGWTGISDFEAALFRDIPGVLFTHWKHKILVGPIEITDPAGRSTKYTYNYYGQLTSVIGPDEKPMVEYEYSTEYR